MSSRRKTATPVAATEPTTLNDINVCGPDALDIRRYPTERELAQWFDRMKVYTEAMHGVGRVVMVCHIADEHKFYLASVEEAPRV